jgi:hypothetical protein
VVVVIVVMVIDVMMAISVIVMIFVVIMVIMIVAMMIGVMMMIFVVMSYDAGASKLTTHPHLVPRSRMVELYLHSPMSAHGVIIVMMMIVMIMVVILVMVVDDNPVGVGGNGLSDGHPRGDVLGDCGVRH